MNCTSFAMSLFTDLSLTSVLGGVKDFLLPAVGLYIAYRFGNIQAATAQQQASTAALSVRTAKSKLSLDLFEKRWESYSAARALIGAACSRSNVTQEEHGKFLAGTLGARFLFDKSVSDYLTIHMHEKVLDLQRLSGQIAEKGEDPDLRLQRTVIVAWFLDQLGVLNDKMQPFLSIDPQ